MSIRENKTLAQPADKKSVDVMKVVQTFAHDDLTDGGGTDGTIELDGKIPAGAVVLGARVSVLEAFDGTTTLTLGDGTDPDRYNTGTLDVTSTGEKDAGMPSGQRAHAAETTITATISESADFTTITTGVVAVEVLYAA